MKVRFIINPASGTAGRVRRLAGLVREELGGHRGIFEVKATAAKGDAAAFSAEAAAMGYEFVFACGGDGTVNEVASQLVGTGTVLGILPAGSGNALANSLGLPGDPAEGIRLLKTGTVRNIDAGEACGRYFFTTAGFAFEALLSKRYDEGKLSRKIRGIAPYYALGLLEYLRFSPSALAISVDGAGISACPLILTVANTSQLGGGAFIAPGALLDDGLLDICLLAKQSLIKTAGALRRLKNGKIDGHDGYVRLRGKEVLISGRRSTYAHVDGEPFDFSGDVSVRVVPSGLKVLVPSA